MSTEPPGPAPSGGAAHGVPADGSAPDPTQAQAQADAGTPPDRAPAERAQAERAQAERAQAERAQAERAQAERAQAERAQAERAQAERAQAERAQAERAQAERAQAERAQAERAQAERAPAERAKTELARHVLRVALGAPVVYAVADGLGLPFAFLAPLVFVTFAVAMRRAPPAAAAALLLAVMVVVPAGLAAVSSALAGHTLALVAVIAAVLFLAYRTAFDPRTAALGNLVAVFALMTPVLTSQSDLVAGVFPALLSLAGALGLGGVYLAFAVFPAPAVLPTPAPAPAPDAAERTRRALRTVAVMVPLVALYLSLDLAAAVRALIVASTVLLAEDRAARLHRGAVAIASVVIAGAAALVVSLWLTLWPATLPMLLLVALLGLGLAPHALRGPHRAAFAGALATLWTLLGAAADDPLGQTLDWTVLAGAGAAYAVGMHALLAPGAAASPQRA